MNRLAQTSMISVRNLGVRLGTGALYYSGALNLLRRSRGNGHEPQVCPFVVLLYHRVNFDNDPFSPAVPVKVFDAQMRYLAKNFRVRPLMEILGRIKNGSGVEPWTIAITFDDGYRDNYLCAHPILQKYQLPATLFVATGFVETNLLMWNDQLAWALKNTGLKKVVCRVGSRDMTLSLETEGHKLQSLTLLLEELKTHSENDKNVFLENIIYQLGNKKQQPLHLMLDWRELHTMAAQGWDIGSHTVNHLILTKVADSRAAEELRVSKEVIERKLQRAVALCAYPNGKKSDFDSKIKVVAENCGYQGAVTTLPGINTSEVDFFQLQRWSVWEQFLPTLACKLNYEYRRTDDL
jgi:peptidoglycan/xylan/chitin deacetylase (PgdA/CDA1 family)